MKRRNQKVCKRVAAIIAAAVLSLSVTGCGSSFAAAETPAETTAEAPSDAPAPTDEPSTAMSEENAEGTEVHAKITSIDGEKLTVEAFANMGGKGGPGAGGNGEAPSGEAPSGEAPSGEAPSGETSGGKAPEGGKGGRGGQPGGGQDQKGGEAPSGETLELILTSSTEYKDCSAEDLEEETMVVITYNDDNEVVSISIDDNKAPGKPDEQSTEDTEDSSSEETTAETAE